MTLLLPLSSLLLLAGCGGYDYFAHVSEERCDVFLAKTEAFTVELDCVRREHPYASDGITCPLVSVAEVTLKPAQNGAEGYTVSLADGWGGEMSFRSVEDDWFYSASLAVFPETSVTLTVTSGENSWEVEATSIKNEHTMSANEALDIAVKQESDFIASLTENGVFCGEFRVRLLRRNENYYYVGIVSKTGETVSLLLSAEGGEVLARRQTDGNT